MPTAAAVFRRGPPHVFDRFYRADSARTGDNGGSGLGLAISREIASAHGGRLGAEREPGQGSRFSLALPGDAGGISQ